MQVSKRSWCQVREKPKNTPSALFTSTNPSRACNLKPTRANKRTAGHKPQPHKSPRHEREAETQAPGEGRPGSLHPTSFMVELFCSQRHSITLMLLPQRHLPGVEEDCRSASRGRAPAIGAASTATDLHGGRERIRGDDCSMQIQWKCWSCYFAEPQQVCVCLRGESSAPPASLLPLWETEEGKINAGDERQEEPLVQL